jgi:hypothetical protein
MPDTHMSYIRSSAFVLATLTASATLAACASETDQPEPAQASGAALTNDVVKANPLPAGFDKQSAAAKQAELMRRVSKSGYALDKVASAAPLRDIDLAKFGLSVLDTFLLGGNIDTKRIIKQTMDHVSDDMPIEHDNKLIHARGSVAAVELVAVPSKYTGLYAGAKGLIRLSLAIKPGSFTPGMGLKLFVDGKASANVLAMQTVAGQGDDTNFFAHEFSNIIPIAPGGPLQLLERIFKLAAEKTNMLSVMPLARVSVDGTLVAAPVGPCQLYFTPTASTKAMISSRSSNDFRVDLAKAKSGTTLYEVSGSDKCGDASPGARIAIGTLRTTSEMIPSEYGDTALFFKHEEFR